ncbi:hypothetical protein JCM21900_006488 [Sporobolomyces salmonicolor]
MLNPRALRAPAFTRALATLPSRSLASRTYPSLYFHPAPPASSSSPSNPTYSLSFLPTPPPSLAFSPTTIGLLRAPNSNSDSDEPSISPRYFDDNPDFLKLVHEVLRENVHDDPWLQAQAKGMSGAIDGAEGVETYIHITDFRNPPEAGRTPSPQDILASILVSRTGELVPASYEPNYVAYRLVTEDGLMRLPEGLMDKLREACQRVREVEKEVASERDAGERV